MGNNNKLINPNWAKHGYIQIYTGDGKGKTTASLGLAMRALGRNWKVLIVMFTKGGNDYGELNSFRELSPKISDNLKIIQAGLDRIVYINNETEEDIKLLADTQGKSVEQVKNIIASLHEFNPMMGHRGCRLAVTFPEIAEIFRFC